MRPTLNAPQAAGLVFFNTMIPLLTSNAPAFSIGPMFQTFSQGYTLGNSGLKSGKRDNGELLLEKTRLQLSSEF